MGSRVRKNEIRGKQKVSGVCMNEYGYKSVGSLSEKSIDADMGNTNLSGYASNRPKQGRRS